MSANEEERYLLLLMDFQMPELDGYEAREAIQWGKPALNVQIYRP
ncbi:MAG: CheY-like chemotaxis protein [Candidatus Azotimanducaceae bacterium]|jgi:CheY-like chemotaxis protein